jgi:peptidyl-prolyl cis-trans isomerase C
MKRLWLVLSVVSLVFVPACQARGSDPAVQSSASTVPAPTTAVAETPPTTVLARVNGTAIPYRQLEQTQKLYLDKNGQDPKSMPPEKLQSLRKQLLDSLVSSELLYQASVAAKITVSDAAIDEQIQSLKAKFSSDEELTRSLQEQGVTLEEMKERVRRNLATEQLVKQEVDSKIKVSDAEISDYYQKNKERMRRPEGVKMSEIFVRVEPRAGGEAKAKARQKIEAVLKEVRAGKDFAALARQFSESPDAKDGGEMGFVSRNGTLPVLTDAAFKLKVGEVSDVVESPFGYHLLKVTEKKPAGDVSLAEAKPQISNFLSQQKEREAFDAFLSKLKAAARIEILAPTP